MPERVFRVLLGGALAAALALGCGGRDSTRAAVAKGPQLAASAAPSVTAVAAPQPSAPSPPEAAPPKDPLGPLDAELERALFSIAADPAPKAITMNTHYVVSNEDRQHVFHDPVKGRGGVYIGVGAEQGFLFGGWARAELLFLMDFDDWVVAINEVHGLLFEHARTPDELFALWGPEHHDEVVAWIKERFVDRAVSDRKIKVYEQGQPKVHHRLKWLRIWLSDRQLPSFVTDQAEFDHVAKLWRNKRVRCVRGDLTASGTLRAFGDLARRAGWAVRVLYMSNAEHYFTYDQGSFRDNLRALPFDERSVVVHTYPAGGTQYHYIWQDASSYVTWAGRVQTFRDLLHEAKLPVLGKLENGAWLIKPPATGSPAPGNPATGN